MNIRIKRIYESAAPTDGDRIVVDRLWPRGFTRDAARIDDWIPDLGPSNELRRWFSHDPARFEEFRYRYTQELASKKEMLADLRRRARVRTLTLVYSARDTEHNDAVVLADVLRHGIRTEIGKTR